jgi:CheY-like chemotaxis protein
MPRILVLDDDPLISAMVEDWLSELGFDTAGPVATCREALDLIGREKVDGAILDVSLSGEDCYPVADRLREIGVPMAFATGYGAGGVAERFKGSPVLSKPFDFKAVNEILGKLTRNHAQC